MADDTAQHLLDMELFDPSKFLTLSVEVNEDTGIAVAELDRPEPVSYTHLTLPTIYSV